MSKKQYDFSTGKRGAINPIPPGKTQITLYLDDEIEDCLVDTGIEDLAHQHDIYLNTVTTTKPLVRSQIA